MRRTQRSHCHLPRREAGAPSAPALAERTAHALLTLHEVLLMTTYDAVVNRHEIFREVFGVIGGLTKTLEMR
jgi:hypothetical protein